MQWNRQVIIFLLKRMQKENVKFALFSFVQCVLIKDSSASGVVNGMHVDTVKAKLWNSHVKIVIINK